jgi:predicted ATPase
MDSITQLCLRLEGLPLAIELAAARMQSVAPRDLLIRLDRQLLALNSGPAMATPRQHTLRATLDWSYGLLSHAERDALDELAVFVDSFTLDAAESVCAVELETTAVLGLLSSLVDHSLVSFQPAADGTGRYRLLEYVRQYGGEHLERTRTLEATRATSAPTGCRLRCGCGDWPTVLGASTTRRAPRTRKVCRLPGSAINQFGPC